MIASIVTAIRSVIIDIMGWDRLHAIANSVENRLFVLDVSLESIKTTSAVIAAE